VITAIRFGLLRQVTKRRELRRLEESSPRARPGTQHDQLEEETGRFMHAWNRSKGFSDVQAALAGRRGGSGAFLDAGSGEQANRCPKVAADARGMHLGNSKSLIISRILGFSLETSNLA
jgi:hypothetical protein